MTEIGSGWIRLVLAHPFSLNSGAPIASANFIIDGKVAMANATKKGLLTVMGDLLFKTNG